MPHYKPCPPSDEAYCFNGGDCFYIPEDPTIYICSCYMPYYGPRCEHEASRSPLVPASLDDAQGYNKRSVDRALIIAALFFVILTFLGVLIFTLYWSFFRKRRGTGNSTWTKGKLFTVTSPTDTEGRTECGVQASFGDSDLPLPVSNQSAFFECVQNDPCTMLNQSLTMDTPGENQVDRTDWMKSEEEIFRELKQPYLVKRTDPKPTRRYSKSIDRVDEGRNKMNSRLSIRLESNEFENVVLPTSKEKHHQDHFAEQSDSDNAKVRECLQLYGDDKSLARQNMNTKIRSKNNRLEDRSMRFSSWTPVVRNASRRNSNWNNLVEDYPDSSEEVSFSNLEREQTDSAELPPYTDHACGQHTWSPPKGPCTFIVASEHDALLSDLFTRGHSPADTVSH